MIGTNDIINESLAAQGLTSFLYKRASLQRPPGMTKNLNGTVSIRLWQSGYNSRDVAASERSLLRS